MKNFSLNKKISEKAGMLIEKYTNSQYSLHFFPPESKMKDNDVEILKKIENSCFAPGMSDAHRMPAYIEDNNVFAFREIDTIIAAVMFKEQDNHRKPGEKMIFIEDLLVDPDFQQRGFGKKLLSIVLELTDFFGIDIALESPPRNQKYYSQFGFNIIRGESSGVWLATGSDHKSFPIKKLCMWRQCNSTCQLTYPDREEKIKSTDGQAPATVAQMNAIKKLALFTLANTSFWYSHFGHSAEKEKALGAIKEELDIHISDIKQKRSLSMLSLAAMTQAIIKNSLVIRGSGNNRRTTTSSIAIFEILSGKASSESKISSNISHDEIKLIKDLLSAKTIIDYSSYSIFCKTFSRSGKHDPEKSPYYYYEDFNEGSPVIQK